MTSILKELQEDARRSRAELEAADRLRDAAPALLIACEKALAWARVPREPADHERTWAEDIDPALAAAVREATGDDRWTTT